MRTEQTIDRSVQAGRAIRIAAMVTTGLVAFSWVYFGRLYLIHDPGEWRDRQSAARISALYHPSYWALPTSLVAWAF